MKTVRQISGWTHQMHMPHSVMWLGHIFENKYFWLIMAAVLFIALLVVLAILAPEGNPEQLRVTPFGPYPYIP
ncbi:MAG: hypothetical protein PHF37_04235 [Phycisphaerae bacterium]|nr:hypothetical protein [Phycisphaerae bacterium]